MGSQRRSTDYLWFRNNTSQIWFSRAVPKEHVAAEGRKQIQFSLRTTDRREALAKARREASEQDARWGLLPADETTSNQLRVPTNDELEEAAVVAAYELEVETADRGRQRLRGRGANMWRGHTNWSRAELEEQKRLTSTRDFSNVKAIADQVIDAMGWCLRPSDRAYDDFCHLLNKQRLNAMLAIVERNDGNVDFDPSDPVIERVRDRQNSRAVDGERIMDLFERWAADLLGRRAKRPDTVAQDRKVLLQFAEFMGEDRSIDSITARDMAEYRDLLRDLPPKWRDKKALSGLGVRNAAARARKLGLRQTAHTTVNKHLSTISPLYKWLAADPRWAGLRNPCDGLFYTKVRGRNRRPSFTTPQLNSILLSPLFTGCEAEGREHKPGELMIEDWRKWVPLVCMFTGARIGEVAQMALGDVSRERGVWFIHIRHDEQTGQTTKSGRSRPAAVHYLLEGMGFIDFVDGRREACDGNDSEPLFRGIERDARGQFGATVSRWWRKYLTKIGVKNGADGFGAHAFRHTLADRLRSEAELLDPEVAVCLGHSQSSTTSGYGQLSQGTVNMLKGWVDSVRFDGVDFEHLLHDE